jgi:hypothetical protein
MRRRYLRHALLSLLALCALMIWAGTAFSAANVLTEDSDFKNPERGAWGFIPDYTGMIEGDSVDWIWTKPGVNLSQYKTVQVPEFENISNQTDITAQDLLTRNMKDGLSRRLGLKVVDKNADITVKGAMVDYFSGNTATRVWVGFGAGEPFTEVEIYVVDNKTKEIISKVRNQSHEYSIEGAIAATISDIIDEWAKR